MKSNTKRILGLILALVLAFSAFGGMALAAGDPDPREYLGGTAFDPFDPTNPDSSAYEVSKPTTAESITVSFVIEAGDVTEMYEDVIPDTRFRMEIPQVALANASGFYTVYDLLNVIQAQGDFDFTFVYDPIKDAYYLSAVEYDAASTTPWTAGQWGNDGWVFRVNDLFPAELLPGYADTYYEGTAINQTYLNDGDVVHFFYDFPGQFASTLPYNMAADYVRGIVEAYDVRTGTLDIQLQTHDTNINVPNDRQFEVNDYDDTPWAYGAIKVYLLDTSGAEIAEDLSDASGLVSFSGVAPGTYIIKTDSLLRNITVSPWEDFIDYAYFVYTGAYRKITIS
jgi:hypothetical protein